MHGIKIERPLVLLSGVWLAYFLVMAVGGPSDYRFFLAITVFVVVLWFCAFWDSGLRYDKE